MNSIRQATFPLVHPIRHEMSVGIVFQRSISVPGGRQLCEPAEAANLEFSILNVSSSRALTDEHRLGTRRAPAPIGGESYKMPSDSLAEHRFVKKSPNREQLNEPNCEF